MAKRPHEMIFKTDRRKADRRQKVDPRYRNPNYPEFIDRRSGTDRRCEGDCAQATFIQEFFTKRNAVAIIGGATAGLLIYLFILALIHLKSLAN
jgi:hypothetical protein